MKKYHITYYVQPGDLFSKGEVIEAEDELTALINWRNHNLDAIFLSIISSELVETMAKARG